MTALMLEFELESDDSGTHCENNEEEAAMLKSLARILDEDGAVLEGQQVAAQRVKICSCGYYTCGLITRLGTPVPTFKADIEPLYPQSQRDKRALEINQ